MASSCLACDTFSCQIYCDSADQGVKQGCLGLCAGVGVDGLHCISGMCDLCGEPCDANTQELNVLSCTFKNCEDLPYHQDCLEKVNML
jgi:hypothetical protein